MSRRLLATAAIAAFLAVACETGDRRPSSGSTGPESSAPVRVDPGAEHPDRVTRAVAALHPTVGSAAGGVVTFEERGDDLVVIADAWGLPPGEHAFHIHLFGDCTGPRAETAGTHFNLHGPSQDPPADIDRITGDLGELVADASGRAHAETVLENASLHGEFSVLARSVVVHERGNDPTQPPIGGAGGRLACGVIGIAPAQAHA